MDPKTQYLTVGYRETTVDFDYRGIAINQSDDGDTPHTEAVFIPWELWPRLREMVESARADAKAGVWS